MLKSFGACSMEPTCYDSSTTHTHIEKNKKKILKIKKTKKYKNIEKKKIIYIIFHFKNQYIKNFS